MANEKDQFANMALIKVTESAANTLTFQKLETGISLTEKVAWVISRIEYNLEGLTSGVFNGDGDYLSWGMSISNAWAAPTLSETTILDMNTLALNLVGAVTSEWFHHLPFIKDFSTLPGGGLIVPPTPLYLFAKGGGLTAAMVVNARIWYTLLKLSVDQYWELVEARRVLSS